MVKIYNHFFIKKLPYNIVYTPRAPACAPTALGLHTELENVAAAAAKITSAVVTILKF